VEEKWRGCSHSPVGGRASSASIKARSQGPSRGEEYEHGFDAIEIRGVARRGQMLRECKMKRERGQKTAKERETRASLRRRVTGVSGEERRGEEKRKREGGGETGGGGEREGNCAPRCAKASQAAVACASARK
jgi:hypothetical protein